MMMDQKEKMLWMTRTAVFAALLVVLQAATAPLGSTILTGTLVNALLAASAMTCGAMSGATVAVISPFLAKLLGIGPLWAIIPFIALGNIVYVLAWHFLGNRDSGSVYALAAAAIAKFLVLYLGIVRVALPLLGLPQPQAALVSHLFSFPQLVTALSGGAAALPVVRALRKSVLR